ncbi:ABC transporter ATP-binding protein [Cryptosporangium aurantiacum]|uniref:ABC-2 type transport system ATP-binding protein n=1 Tax=Cryptosporangium aurantiacum TaxID=134849 RepID=A0A1M7J8F6_9ACTN|nr:ABC transporter ATP-binding protein [Cryptosporangium aurantiacum]SHM49274.1 ABC-2 type transport system ATP-binding protein [Cryptosporangium aurantiacum]
MNAVEVRELTRTYRSGAEAVRGISFTVRPGGVFGLLGTNGAGKTSTMDVVAGLASPTTGTVRVLGHDPIRERRAVRHRTGVVLQSGGLPGELTVAEAVRMWSGTMRRPRPATEAIESVDLGARLNVPIKSLSGGERRRLDLAVALLGRPDLLLLDEPTTGLDAESRRQVWTLIRALVDDGTAVLLTTHHLEEAEELSDSLAILHRGRIVAEGTLDEVVATHRAEIRWGAAAGRPPAGVLDGEAVEVSSRHVVVRTGTLQRTLVRVLCWAEDTGVVLPELRATPASLETAFLALARGEESADRELEGVR